MVETGIALSTVAAGLVGFEDCGLTAAGSAICCSYIMPIALLGASSERGSYLEGFFLACTYPVTLILCIFSFMYFIFSFGSSSKSRSRKFLCSFF